MNVGVKDGTAVNEGVGFTVFTAVGEEVNAGTDEGVFVENVKTRLDIVGVAEG